MAGKKAAITQDDIQNPLYVELEEGGARTTRAARKAKTAQKPSKE